MIDHVALYATDLEGSRRFYERALEPLGYAVSAEMEGFVGFAHEGSLRLVLRTGKEASTTGHVAFQADERPTVDGFHAAATSAGGTDEGAPGVREHYHASYYAAFVAELRTMGLLTLARQRGYPPPPAASAGRLPAVLPTTSQAPRHHSIALSIRCAWCVASECQAAWVRLFSSAMRRAVRSSLLISLILRSVSLSAVTCSTRSVGRPYTRFVHSWIARSASASFPCLMIASSRASILRRCLSPSRLRDFRRVPRLYRRAL
jgi:catechol 2,3-dioxygenase-like lactoylglutathione lyase family enzyme